MHPTLRGLCEAHLEKSFLAHLPIRVAVSYRGPDEQAVAFTKGASLATFGKSPHNFDPCLGYDVVFLPESPGDKDVYDLSTIPADVEWDMVGRVGKEVGLEWGGDWVKLKDRPHFQLANWRQYVKA